MPLKVLAVVAVTLFLACRPSDGTRTVVKNGGTGSSNFMLSIVRTEDGTQATPRFVSMRVGASDTPGVFVDLSDERQTNIDVLPPEQQRLTILGSQAADAGEEIIHGEEEEDSLTAGRMMLRHSRVNLAPEKTVSCV